MLGFKFFNSPILSDFRRFLKPRSGGSVGSSNTTSRSESFEDIRDFRDIPEPKKKRHRNVQLTGQGLSRGLTNIYNKFEVNLKHLGEGHLSVTLEGPSEAEVNFENKNGHLSFTYRVQEPGNYSLDVRYMDEHIGKSPYLITIRKNEHFLKAICVSGKGMYKLKDENPEFNIEIDTKKTGPGALSVTVDGPEKIKVEFIKMNKNLYKVRYYPKAHGYYFLRVKFNGRHVKGSPFRAEFHAETFANDEFQLQKLLYLRKISKKEINV